MNILGYAYIVNGDQSFRELGCMGDSDYMHLVIRIAKDLPRQQQISTMIHEVLECIKSHNEIELSHSDLCTIEADLFQVFSDAGVDLSPLLAELTEDGGVVDGR